MIEERKDPALKYVEMPPAFKSKASELNLWLKQSQRTCERLAIHLASKKVKDQKDFEQTEFLKDFVLKTSKANELTHELLEYLTGFLNDVAADAGSLLNGAAVRDQIQMQSDTIVILTQQRNDAIEELATIYHEAIRKNKATN